MSARDRLHGPLHSCRATQDTLVGSIRPHPRCDDDTEGKQGYTVGHQISAQVEVKMATTSTLQDAGVTDASDSGPVVSVDGMEWPWCFKGRMCRQ